MGTLKCPGNADSRADADQIRLYLKTLLLICPFPFTSFCSLNQFLPCSTFNSNFTMHIKLANKKNQNQKHRMPNKNSNYSKENNDQTSVSDSMNMQSLLRSTAMYGGGWPEVKEATECCRDCCKPGSPYFWAAKQYDALYQAGHGGDCPSQTDKAVRCGGGAPA